MCRAACYRPEKCDDYIDPEGYIGLEPLVEMDVTIENVVETMGSGVQRIYIHACIRFYLFQAAVDHSCILVLRVTRIGPSIMPHLKKVDSF